MNSTDPDVKSTDPESSIYGFQCPVSHSTLTLAEDSAGQRLLSEQGQEWRYEDGIADFRHFPAAEDASTVEGLLELLQDAEQTSCTEALARMDENAIRYLTNEDRSRYIDLLPLDATKRVLEIGASRGQHTRLIAQRCREVVALEVVPQQAKFGALWCAQDGLTNVRFAAGGDNCVLPCVDGCFDVVVLNYVFEWCGVRSTGDFAAAQERMLSECHRVLAEHGTLFLSTKNRFSIRYLLGAVDEHADMRFGNALPRWLMRGASKVLRRPVNGLLHSHRALSAKLRRAGFDELEAYWAVPDARFPTLYARFGGPEMQEGRRVAGQSGRWARLLGGLPESVIRLVAPSHVFLARKTTNA